MLTAHYLRAPLIDYGPTNHTNIRNKVLACIEENADLTEPLYFDMNLCTLPPVYAVVLSDENNDVLGQLLQRKVDIHRKWGMFTILFEAIRMNAHKNLALLLEHIAQQEKEPLALINDSNNFLNITPLHFAVGKCSCCVERLLRYGAKPHAQDMYGNTPLHKVIQCSDFSKSAHDMLQILKLLKGAGADLKAENKQGETFESLAHERITYLANRRYLKDEGIQCSKKLSEIMEEFASLTNTKND